MANPQPSYAFSSTTPAAPAGYRNVQVQTDNGNPLQRYSANFDNVAGAVTKAANYTAAAGDRGWLLVFTAPAILTLPNPPPDAHWRVLFLNLSTGNLTVTSAAQINSASASILISPQFSGEARADGTNYFLMEGGQVNGLPPATIRQGFIQYYLAGKPGPSAKGYADPTGNLTTFQIPANFTGASGACGATPTGTAVYTFAKNGTSFGTLTIATSGLFTWATTGGAATSFVPGTDELSWTAPGTQDATLSDVRFGIPVLFS